MIEAVVMQAGFKLLLAFFGIVLAVGMLWLLDRNINGLDFADSLRESSANERNIYYAARILGVCILVGLVIS